MNLKLHSTKLTKDFFTPSIKAIYERQSLSSHSDAIRGPYTHACVRSANDLFGFIRKIDIALAIRKLVLLLEYSNSWKNTTK